MSSAPGVLAEGVAERLWHRIQAQDRLDAADETATGPTHGERLAADPARLAGAVEETLSSVLAAVATAERRAALRRLRAGEAIGVTPEVDTLLRAGLAVAGWDGEEVAASDAGRALGELCDELAERVTELVGRRLRRDG
ncbi:MAG TPA: hypothetical protein VH134_15675 [Candidatus Dormibacteraeota bacterium]|jgi:hypothetical protein|nr:hypothetical protein [Candidatus Dormibacteraeota bacterium]